MPNKISVVLDVVTDKAVGSIKGFKQSIADADGAVGKMKAGATSAFDTIKANAGVAALAAGTALVGFGVKAVGAFQDTALAAGEMSDKLKLSVEDSSRLIEVAGDIGIEVGTLESTIGRMNKTAGESPAKFDEIGASIVRNKDGTINVKDTFLAVVDALNQMPDAGARAKAGADIFGRGWAEIAELVETGSADIVTAMGNVSEAKVIDPDELAKAREFREKMDAFKDSVEDLALSLGEELTPAIGVVVDVLGTIAPAVGSVVGAVGDAFVGMTDAAYAFGSGVADVVDALPWVDLVEPIGPTLYEWEKLERGTGELVAEFAKGNPTVSEFRAKVEESGASMEATNLAVIEYAKQLKAANLETLAADGANRVYIDGHGVLQGVLDDTATDTDDLTGSNKLLEDQIRETTDRYKDLKGELSAEEEFHNAEQMWADLQASAVEAYDAAATGADDAKQKAFDHAGAVIDAKQKVVELGEQYAELPEEEVTRIVALIDEGKLAEAEAAFNTLTRNRTMQVSVVASGASGNFNIPVHGSIVVGASGGVVTQPTLALIGESGPEAVIPLDHAPGSSPLGAMGAGSVFAITVNAGMGADGRRIGDSVVDAIKDFERRNGNAWRR